METDLLERVCRQRGRGFRSRAEFIRAACEHYLRLIESAEADQRYRAGYREKPEDGTLAEATARATASIQAREDWD